MKAETSEDNRLLEAEQEYLIDKRIAAFYPKPIDLIKQLLKMSIRQD